MHTIELVPPCLSTKGHHDVSGLGAGGMWFPTEHLVPRKGFKTKHWHLEWPKYITDRLVTSVNPNGTFSTSDLEFAGGLLHLEALAQSSDIQEQTVFGKTNNPNTLFWQHKGSTTTTNAPAHLLHLFGIHQRFHRYFPMYDDLSGPFNPVVDALAHDFELFWSELTYLLVPYIHHDFQV